MILLILPLFVGWIINNDALCSISMSFRITINDAGRIDGNVIYSAFDVGGCW